jgi:hypothetical protein
VLSGPTKNFGGERAATLAAAVSEAAGLFSFASPDVRAVCRFLGH